MGRHGGLRALVSNFAVTTAVVLVLLISSPTVVVAGPVCSSHTSGVCNVCDACCSDLSDTACSSCVAMQCAANQCDPGAQPVNGSSACNVCPVCCKAMYAQDSDCEACVNAQCQKPDGDFVCADTRNTCSKDCIRHCLGERSSPCLIDCHTAHGALLFVVSCLPFLGRFLLDFVAKRVCKKAKNQSEEGLVSEQSATRGQSMSEVFMDGGDKCTCENLGKGALRLTLWHWLQPVIYFIVLYNYFDLVGPWQQFFGMLVALREALYLISTLVALFANPSYLAVDITVTLEEDGLVEFLMYMLAPEVFVWTAIALDGGFNLSCRVWFGGSVLYMILEACGVAALAIGILSDNLPWPLAVGYAVTAIASMFSLPMFFIGLADRCREGNDEDDDDFM